jgi:hypothetical protein
VNIPARESDLAAFSEIEFQQQVVRIPPPEATARMAGFFSPTDHQKELWRLLLFAVLALLFIELFTANRTPA